MVTAERHNMKFHSVLEEGKKRRMLIFPFFLNENSCRTDFSGIFLREIFTLQILDFQNAL
jgi:hypothetical protein